MILPHVCASFTRQDAIHVVELLGKHDRELRDAARERLETEGLDALLDDPRLLNAVLTDPDVRARPELVFYVVIRQALLESGIDDTGTADFVTSLVLAFGRARRAWRLSDTEEQEYAYLVDLVATLRGADARRAFMVRSHLGNYSLWLAGLFPDWVDRRARRRGAPDLDYYDRMGAGGYRTASRSTEARDLCVEGVLSALARDFTGARVALNRVSERYLWPTAGDATDRLFRRLGRGDV